MISHHTRENRTDKSPLRARSGLNLIHLLVAFAIIAVVIALFLPSVRRIPRWIIQRDQCAGNLRQIAIALHNYADQYGSFPPAYTVDDTGRPLHSWRTLILPNLEQQALYDSIDLSKPWDDPANAAALAAVPDRYRCPATDMPANCTTYLGIVSPTAFFHPTEGRRFSEITRDHSATLMVVEVSSDRAVPWMAPSDTDGSFVPTTELDANSSHTVTNGVCVDGHVEWLSSDMPIEERRAMLTIAGEEHAADAASSSEAQ